VQAAQKRLAGVVAESRRRAEGVCRRPWKSAGRRAGRNVPSAGRVSQALGPAATTYSTGC